MTEIVVKSASGVRCVLRSKLHWWECIDALNKIFGGPDIGGPVIPEKDGTPRRK